MTNALAIKNPTVPIKAISQTDLKETLEGVFAVWISNLLCLTGEVSAKRLILALPAIEKHFWSMSFTEIQKAFEDYADGKLGIKPIPNYFDRILVGQIFKEYKNNQRSNEIKKVDSEELKEIEDYKNCVIFFDGYKQGFTIKESDVWVYDYLVDYKKLVEYSEKDRITAYNIELENTKDEDQAKTRAKLKLVYRYFDKLIAKDKHVKEYL